MSLMEIWNQEPILFWSILAIVSGVIVICVVFFGKIISFFKGKPRTKTPQMAKTEAKTVAESAKSVDTCGIDIDEECPDVKARIYDKTTRRIYNETVHGDIVKKIKQSEPDHTLGRIWNYYGEEVYAFTKQIIQGTELYSVVRPPVTIESSAERLHRALNVPWVSLVFPVPKSRDLLEKLKPIIILAGCAVFAMFLLIANKMQG